MTSNDTCRLALSGEEDGQLIGQVSKVSVPPLTPVNKQLAFCTERVVFHCTLNAARSERIHVTTESIPLLYDDRIPKSTTEVNHITGMVCVCGFIDRCRTASIL